MKLDQIFENEFIGRDKSKIANIAVQLASSAATKFKGPKAKEAAIAGVNRVHSIMLQTIDEYFNNNQMRDIN